MRLDNLLFCAPDFPMSKWLMACNDLMPLFF